MAERDDTIREVAQKRGLSEGAVQALWDALRRGGGRQAQFSHPELGGMGQWSGGMVQIGTMFDYDLQAKVAGACADLAGRASTAGEVHAGGSHQSQRQGGGADFARWDGDAGGGMRDEAWWPAHLGRPASAGAQNAMRYAYFAERRRLAIERDGRVTLYDTAHHRIGGVSQQQSWCRDLVFTSQDGPIDLASLHIVEE